MPMGPGGTDVNMRTGKPLTPVKPEEQVAKIKRRFEMAVQDAWNISAELHQNKVILRIFLEQYRDLLVKLLSTDPADANSLSRLVAQLQALEAPIRAISDTLEVKPIMAEREAIRRLGPQLASLVEAGTEAAP
jgi:hypothetical protein